MKRHSYKCPVRDNYSPSVFTITPFAIHTVYFNTHQS